MKIKTADLIGPALRYAVAVCEGFNVGILTVEEQWERFIEGASPEDLEKYADEYADIKAGFKTEICKVHDDGYKSALDARAWRFDEDWGVGGPIIDRALISVVHNDDEGQWEAGQRVQLQSMFGFNGDNYSVGPTSLIAAMRCHVTSELGDEVEIPDELMKQT